MIASQAVERTCISRYTRALTGGSWAKLVRGFSIFVEVSSQGVFFLTPYNLRPETYKVVPQIS